MAKQTVTLQPGESEVVTFEATPSKAKTYQVLVDGLSGSFKAMWKPPDIRLYSLSIQHPSPEVGQPVYIFVRAVNDGGPGSRTILCQVPLLDYAKEKTITLASGEPTQVTFTLYPTKPGAYQASVNGLTGSFEVLEVRPTPKFSVCNEAYFAYLDVNVHIDKVWWYEEGKCWAYDVTRPDGIRQSLNERFLSEPR